MFFENKILKYLLSFALMLSFLSGCYSTAKFDSKIMYQLNELRTRSLVIVGLATEDYSKHENSVNKLKDDLISAYEYVKKSDLNEATVKQVDLLLSDKGHLLGGFLEKWQQKGKLSQVFVNGMRQNISKTFDQIIILEGSKRK